MNRFNPNEDRDKAMLHTVSYHDRPMPRAIAYCLHSCEVRGAKVSVASCIRVDSVIEEHNREFGTDLHGQQFCIDMHAKDPAHFAAANSPSTTSHCFFSDGNPAYRDPKTGGVIPATHKLPVWMVGIDVDDIGKVEDNSHLLHVAGQFGLHFVSPYKSGTEHHHLVCAINPIPTLEHHGVISKERHAG